MNIIYLLIGISLILVVVIARFLFWAVKSGQYDDLEAPRHQILMDDDDTRMPPGEERPGQGD
ncbi:MAG: cbb3-type cytochrome oxidase assembly protein CcoS [Gammaproteobacteria bacterium]|jgi:cbb3-type cytochrome oxidase maturation protein